MIRRHLNTFLAQQYSLVIVLIAMILFSLSLGLVLVIPFVYIIYATYALSLLDVSIYSTIDLLAISFLISLIVTILVYVFYVNRVGKSLRVNGKELFTVLMYTSGILISLNIWIHIFLTLYAVIGFLCCSKLLS